MGGDTSRRWPILLSRVVSIAGGDSWVGIRDHYHVRPQRLKVSIAGGDSWVGIRTIVK